ncbi:VCBS domain-containing protein [Vibrio lentus]|nr:VCBS domain-containing protein [Vibrio lentus]
MTEGSLTFNDDGSYIVHSRQRLDDAGVGQDRDVTFTYTATDNDTGVSCAEMTITITVTGSNDAPVAKDATETTGRKHGTERQRASGHGCGRYGRKLPVG